MQESEESAAAEVTDTMILSKNFPELIEQIVGLKYALSPSNKPAIWEKKTWLTTFSYVSTFWKQLTFKHAH